MAIKVAVFLLLARALAAERGCPRIRAEWTCPQCTNWRDIKTVSTSRLDLTVDALTGAARIGCRRESRKNTDHGQSNEKCEHKNSHHQVSLTR
jgi:hypothetical protein